MISTRTKSADDTKELAAAVAGLVRPGDLVLLAGELGAGKTTFTQGFGRALGITGPITSPTFTLMHTYQGSRMPLLHVDLYRIEQLSEIVDLGITELIDDHGVALLEWGDLAEPVLPADFLEIRFFYGAEDDERELRLRPVGSKWTARAVQLEAAVDRWVVPA